MEAKRGGIGMGKVIGVQGNARNSAERSYDLKYANNSGSTIFKHLSDNTAPIPSPPNRPKGLNLSLLTSNIHARRGNAPSTPYAPLLASAAS